MSVACDDDVVRQRRGIFEKPCSASSEIGSNRSRYYFAQDAFAYCRGQWSLGQARFYPANCEAWHSRQRDRDTPFFPCEQRRVSEGNFQIFLHLLPAG